MASIDDALRQTLLENAGVSAWVGSRIHSPFLPQSGPYPAIAFRTPDEEREPTLDVGITGPPMTRFVFFSAVKEPSAGLAAKEIARRIDEAIRHALLPLRGDVAVTASSPPETVAIQGVFFVTRAQQFDDRTQTHEYASVYDVHYSETIPD